jgi:hypothetical protein
MVLHCGAHKRNGQFASDLHYSVAAGETMPAGLPSRKQVGVLPSNLDEASGGCCLVVLAFMGY